MGAGEPCSGGGTAAACRGFCTLPSSTAAAGCFEALAVGEDDSHLCLQLIQKSASESSTFFPLLKHDVLPSASATHSAFEVFDTKALNFSVIDCRF